MHYKPILAVGLMLVASGCIAQTAGSSSRTAQDVAQSEGGPKSDVTPGTSSGKDAVETEEERAERIKKQQEREAVHRQRMGVCTHH